MQKFFLRMKKILLAFCAVALVVACSSSDGGDTVDNGSKNYDRTAILTNWADNIIIPAYDNYVAKLGTLSAKTTAFTAAADAAKLAEVRAAWLDAYVAYQSISQFDFGLAENYYIKESANTYPTDVAGIEANMVSGSYDLTTQVQFSRQGFPGIDYLINGKGTDAETVAFYANGNAATYLNAIVNQQKTIAETITADWKTKYRDEYVKNNGTSISSGVNRTTNNFIKNYEKDIRAAKVGIPAGIFSNGQTFADKVEGYYKNNVSRTLLVAALQAEKDFFNGKAFNGTTSGPSLKSALDGLKAVREGKNLSDIINTQFDTALTDANALNESFSQQITTDNAKMLTAYQSMQQNLIYFKVDMISALNITIDYVDGDGD